MASLPRAPRRSQGANSLCTVGGNGTFNVGFYGSGTLAISDGGTLNDKSGLIGGFRERAIGLATITGSGSSWNSVNELAIDNNGTDTLNVTAGGRVTSGSGIIAAVAGSNGIVTISGNGSAWTVAGDLLKSLQKSACAAQFDQRRSISVTVPAANRNKFFRLKSP